ncbi:MAG: LysM peptidoglycan-binding domain-containing protein [Muribaculaceae bacterium]
MKFNIARLLLTAVIAAMACCTATALDLPVKHINGTSYYYYTVKKGDTLFSLSRTLGISSDEIISCNPSVADGLRADATLYFPVAQFGGEDDGEAPQATLRHEVKKGETLFGISHTYGVSPDDIVRLNPDAESGIRTGQILIIPNGRAAQPTAATGHKSSATAKPSHVADADDDATADTPATAEADDVADDADADVNDSGSVAIALPFMLNEATPSKAARRQLDFYRGFLIAADRLSRNNATKIKVSVYDTADSLALVNEIMRKPEITDADVIIAPDDAAQIKAILHTAADNGTYVMTLFNIRDTSYVTVPSALQANTPHDRMYDKAAHAMMSTFGGCTPVIISNARGNNDKEAFTTYVRNLYTAEGITPIEISYDGSLRTSDLEGLAEGNQYVILPSSGTVSEFGKFAYAVRSYRETLADPSSLHLFGYPDWTAFRGDNADMLHELGAVIYSRFFDDTTTADRAAFVSDFTRHYGVAPLDGVPNFALLGYDTAAYILRNIQANKGTFDPEVPARHVGLQSAFDIKPYDAGNSEANAGYYNDAIYIITYLSGDNVITSVL